MNLRTSVVFLSLLATPALADTVTVTFSGIVIDKGGDIWGRDGIDHGGIFGSVGASLIGDSVTVTWTAIDCSCLGSGINNPIIDATLTINGITFDFGSGTSGIFLSNIQQVGSIASGPMLSTAYPGGSFLLGPEGYPMTTGGYLAMVPGPVAGTGILGLVMLVVFSGG